MKLPNSSILALQHRKNQSRQDSSLFEPFYLGCSISGNFVDSSTDDLMDDTTT